MVRILFLNIIFLSSVAVAREYVFERITSNDGLSQNTVLSIHQCSEGYMWFTTYDGLNRYDGYDFKVYHNSPDDTNSISSNLLSWVTENSKENLCVATFTEGICRLDKKTDKFKTFHNIPGSSEKISGDGILWLFTDSEDNIWVCTISGIVFLETNNGTACPDIFRGAQRS